MQGKHSVIPGATLMVNHMAVLAEEIDSMIEHSREIAIEVLFRYVR